MWSILFIVYMSFRINTVSAIGHSEYDVQLYPADMVMCFTCLLACSSIHASRVSYVVSLWFKCAFRNLLRIPGSLRRLLWRRVEISWEGTLPPHCLQKFSQEINFNWVKHRFKSLFSISIKQTWRLNTFCMSVQCGLCTFTLNNLTFCGTTQICLLAEN